MHELAYFRQAWARANAYRLRRVQAGALPEGLLAHELPNLLQSVRESLVAGAWDAVGIFHDHLQQALDVRGHWAELMALSGWARLAAERLGDPRCVARLAHDLANLVHQQGDYPEAERHLPAGRARRPFGRSGRPPRP